MSIANEHLPSNIITADDEHIPDNADHLEDNAPQIEIGTEEEYTGPKDDVRNAVEKAFNTVNSKAVQAKPDADEADDKADAAAKVKQERAADSAKSSKVENKPVKAEQGEAETPASERVNDAERQPEGRKYAEAPARFLPKSKEVWANVPNAVKTDFHRITQEYDAEMERYREASQAYESVREFDQMAKQSGTTLPDALRAYVGLETLLRQDPIAGVAAVLRNVGLTPEQYVQHVMSAPQPQGYAAQAPAVDPQIDALRAEVENMKQERIREQQERIRDQVTSNVISPFAEKNPRYYELEQDIVFFLNSGKVPDSLSPLERLEVAYDMAARINPLSVSAPDDYVSPAPAIRPVDLDGQKSIKGAPLSGRQTPRKSTRGLSIEDSVRASLARLSR